MEKFAIAIDRHVLFFVFNSIKVVEGNYYVNKGQDKYMTDAI